MKTCKKGLHTYDLGLKQCPYCKIEWKKENPDKVRAVLVKWRKNNTQKIKEYNSQLYVANSETKRANSIRWYKDNIEKAKKSHVLWVKKNKEIVRAKEVAYKKANPEKSRRDSSTYKKKNSDKVNALNAKHRAAKILRTPSWLTKEHLDKIEYFYVFTKLLKILFKESFHVDHIVPLQGEHVSGLHVPWNLQILTASENTRKCNSHDICGMEGN